MNIDYSAANHLKTYQDAFQRLRVSNPDTFFDDKHIYGLNTDTWVYPTSGVGAAQTWLSAESAVNLTVGTATGYSIKQSRRYIPYVPGKSDITLLTGVFGTSITNNFRAFGRYDTKNGLFFYHKDGVGGVGVRTDTTGSVVDTFIPQSDWNIDKLNGLGPSGITLDWNDTNIYIINFQWLGVGGVGYGLFIDGAIRLVHKIENANHDLTKVYMRMASLPVRYENRNTGTAANSTTIKAICSAVISEGGSFASGVQCCTSNKTTTRTINSRTPILAIRLANTYGGLENRISAYIKNDDMYAETNAVYYEVAQVTDPTTVTGTFTAIANSACEQSVNISVISGGTERIFKNGFVAVGTKGSTLAPDKTSDPGGRNNVLYISQNFDSTGSQYFVIYATPFTGNSNVSAALSWEEIS